MSEGGMQGDSLCFLGKQQQPFGCKCAREQLLRKNYGRNLCLTRSGPVSLRGLLRPGTCIISKISRCRGNNENGKKRGF